jgi:hypothetical protein
MRLPNGDNRPMPSPIGHALGGIAAGWLVQPHTHGRSPRSYRTATIAFAALGMAPDLDLLLGPHRGPSHSVGAAALVGLVAWMAFRASPSAARMGLTCAAAYGSHVLLDWLGSDSSPPHGLVALWPFSMAHYQAAWPVFLSVSRRIHRPELFWVPNLRALALELLILVPAVSLAAFLRRARPLSEGSGHRGGTSGTATRVQ